ncbi:MAG: response regulator [Mediterranea sp.]|nr:response regulator [Mediterranea sp.]
MINFVYQDRSDIIWICTEDGLNRYDGAKFILYKHDKDDEHSLLNNYVRFFFEDSRERCFVGTLSGLQSYDPATDRFTTIPLVMKGGDAVSVNVSSMTERKNGEVLIGTAGRGIFRLVEENGNLVGRSDDEVVPSAIINLLYEDSRGSLWVGTGDKGLFQVDKSRHVRNFFTNIDGNSITSLCEDGEGNVYIGILGGGLYRYDFRRAECAPIPYPANPALPVKSLYFVGPDEIYIGTDGNGMKVYNILRQRIEEAELSITTFDLTKSKVHSIMKDHSGNLWLGFFQKGVMVLPAMTNAFRYIGYRSAQQNIIGSNCVMSVLEDSEGTLWVGTDNDGLYRVGRDGRQMAHFEHGKDPASVPATIMSVFEDSEGGIWIGSYLQGMAKLDPRTGKCRYIRLPNENGEISNMRVYGFAEDDDKNLWIATMGYGLYRMSLRTGEIDHCLGAENGVEYPKHVDILPSLWITCLLHTDDGKLYIGSYSGLTCLDLATMNFVSTYDSNLLFANSVVYALYADDEHHIWVGTSEGLKCLDTRTGTVREYTTKEGLPNNVVCAIASDKNKELWISTNYGLARFNPTGQNFVCYYANDGLQGNEFSKGAVYADNRGELFFGGVNGVTYFNPLEITDAAQPPSIHITGFYLHNRSVKKGMMSGREAIVDRSVMEADRFNLSHSDNSFSIEFSTMEFGNPERITYMYALGDERWITLRPGINRVSFSDLSPGEYRFSVKAKDYMLYSDVRTVTIHIRPAWYASVWAQWFYLLLAIGITYLIVTQVRHRYRVRQELMEHVHQEKLNEAKLQFFINISHEIRTPMTLIITPLQKLMAADEDEGRQKVYRVIYRNAQRLLTLVNQLMDMRKIDKKQMFLKFQEVEFVSFVREICGTFEYQSRAKDITLDYAPEVEELPVWVDPLHFDKAILNVLSNAFKYTPENGAITLRLRAGKDDTVRGPLGQYVEIEVEDNGIGIAEKEFGRIFDRFYQVRNQANSSGVGTGIGLHLTRSLVELHHGTITAANNAGRPGCHFVIRLPLGNAHLAPEEIEERPAEMPAPTHAQEAAGTLPVFDSEPEEKTRSKSKYRVLVVEDDEEIRRYICRELAADFHTLESVNGREALDLILKKAPDLVISDVMMPEMDGLTLCRKIKQNVNINHVPVILLTAKAGEDSNLEGLDTGADAYFVKPFNIDILKKTVENLIHQREQLRNTFSGSQTQAGKVQQVQIKSPDEKLMERIMSVINAHIGDPTISVDMISSEIGISRVHLHRKLKELTNQSTRDFIRNIRLQQAAALLAEKHHNITEVATMTGFTNVAYFSTAFKDMYGESPTAYMSKMKEERQS